MGVTGNGGSRVAQLRKEREVTQVALTRRARVLLSLLSKIEVGDRALTPAIAAAIARALQISLGAFYGPVRSKLSPPARCTWAACCWPGSSTTGRRRSGTLTRRGGRAKRHRAVARPAP